MLQALAMKYRVYGLVSYDRSAKIRWLLTELGEKFEMVWLNRAKKEHESHEFLKINPMGRIPVLQTETGTIMESGAICTYLADQHLSKGMAPALNSPDRAAYLQWMYFASVTLDIFQTKIMIIEDIPPGDVYNSKLGTLQSDLRDALEVLNRTLEKSSYLVGNSFTAADICVSYHLNWYKLWPELDVVCKDFPKVFDYVERLKKMPSAIEADVFSYKE